MCGKKNHGVSPHQEGFMWAGKQTRLRVNFGQISRAGARLISIPVLAQEPS